MQNLTAAKFPEASFPTANLFTANFPRTIMYHSTLTGNRQHISDIFTIYVSF